MVRVSYKMSFVQTCIFQQILFSERIKVSEIELMCNMHGRNDNCGIYV